MCFRIPGWQVGVFARTLIKDPIDIDRYLCCGECIGLNAEYAPEEILKKPQIILPAAALMAGYPHALEFGKSKSIWKTG